MNQPDVFQALREERNYQLRRWGVRQPDGTMHEQTHSISEFVVFMRDYYDKATSSLTHSFSRLGSLTNLRKLVALGIACIEQHDRYIEAAVTMENVFETVRRAGRIVPMRFSDKTPTDFGTYLLKIRQELSDAEIKLGVMNKAAGLIIIKDIVHIGVECFEQFGVPSRGAIDLVTNARDCQFA